MKCPNCGNEVPARPTCLRCGGNLVNVQGPALPATAYGPVSQPLTAGQRARLLAGCLPFVSFVLMVIGYFIAARLFSLPSAPPPLYLVIAVVLLVTGYDTLQHLRDLISGVALAQEDLLNRSYRSRGGSGTSRCYGRFERLGRLRLSTRDFVQHAPGQRYRVTYSPASKRAWALDPPDLRVWNYSREQVD